MPASDADTPTPVDAAHCYADRGWRVVPIAPGTKHPAGLQQWQKAATIDHDTINNWWTGLYKTHGVGVATGPDSGVWVLDVDTHGADGLATLRELVDAYGRIPETCRVRTGSGGLHIYFRWDPNHPIRNLQGNSRPLGPGIDIRGDGGQVLAPPTIHPNGTPYQWERVGEPADAPDWLYALIERDDPPEPPEPVDTFTAALKPGPQQDGDSIAEWANQQYDLSGLLTADGWTHAGGDKWVRPGKNPRDGHSAVLHDNTVLVVWSTEAADLMTHGKRTTDGSGVAVNTFGYLAATRYGGDRSACARALREQHRQTHPTPTRTQALEHHIDTGFWDARHYLAHIRLAAHARYLPADAVLGAVLTRVSYLTPPQLLLPAIVGSQGSLDVIHAIVGPSGMGKTQAMRTARDLLPGRPGDDRDGLPIGSGEGIIEAYYGTAEIEGDEGRKTKERQQIHTAVLFEVDEGQVLGELGQRSGSTLFTNLRSAWSGGNVGQTNASADRTRLLKSGRYRFAMVVGIQPEKADALLSDAAGGTPQRFAWFTATDPTAPSDPPPWPGELDWRSPQRSITNRQPTWELSVDSSIVTEIRVARHQLLTTGRTEVESHAYLLRLKLAGLLAVLDRRFDINVEDWQLAEQIHDTSRTVRDTMAAAIDAERADRRAARVEAVTAETVGVEEALEARAVMSMAGSIARKVWRDGDLTLREAMWACDSKHRRLGSFDEAVEQAVDDGWIRVEGGTVSRGDTKPPRPRRVTK